MTVAIAWSVLAAPSPQAAPERAVAPATGARVRAPGGFDRHAEDCPRGEAGSGLWRGDLPSNGSGLSQPAAADDGGVYLTRHEALQYWSILAFDCQGKLSLDRRLERPGDLPPSMRGLGLSEAAPVVDDGGRLLLVAISGIYPQPVTAPPFLPPLPGGILSLDRDGAARWREPQLARWLPRRVDELPVQPHVVSARRTDVPSFPLDLNDVTGLAAAGSMVVLLTQDPQPRLIAFALDAVPPQKLWEHRLRSDLIDSPVLGSLDPSGENVELVYLDRRGTVISLDVPSARAGEGVPRLRWVVQPEEAAVGLTDGGLVLGDGGLVYVAFRDTVRAIDRRDGTERWLLQLDGQSSNGMLALGATGILFAGTKPGYLYAIATESRGLDPDAAWPAPRGDGRNTGRAGW